MARTQPSGESHTARALLVETLSRYAAVEPGAWRFTRGAQGKPAIAAPAGVELGFNLSHAGGLVACAVTPGEEVGVDLEDTARDCEHLDLAERVFAAEEQRALRRLGVRARAQFFFELWTLKEAWLKARGTGFALDPRCVSFDLGQPGRIRARFDGEAQDDPAGWWFGLLEPEPGRVLALAVRNGGRPARVRCFSAAPGGARSAELGLRPYAQSSAPLFPAPVPG